MNPKLKYGIVLAFITAIFSGIANFANKLVVQNMDPLVNTTLRNTLVALLLISLVVVFKKYRQLKELKKSDIFLLFLIGVIGGSLPFYLFFTALKYIPAVNASLIHKTLIFWVAILAVPVLKEKITRLQAAAILLIFLANFFVGGWQGFLLNGFEAMVLAATLLWAVENIIAKIALKRIDQDIVIASRMGVGSLLLLAATAITGKIPVLFSIDLEILWQIAFTAVLLFGYVICWYRALRLAPVTLVATILSFATLITNLLSAIFITRRFSLAQFYEVSFIIVGLWLFLTAAKRMGENRKITLGFSK